MVKGWKKREDPWQILGVDKGHELSKVKHAYREALKACHPDLFPGNRYARKRFQEITRAYKEIIRLTTVEAVPIGLEEEGTLESLFSSDAHIKDYSFYYLEVPMEAAFLGRAIQVFLPGPEAECKRCKGQGFVWEGNRQVCPHCTARGYTYLSWGKERVRVVCKACGGTGFQGRIQCPDCIGKGVLRHSIALQLRLPRGTRQGGLFRLKADNMLGIGDAFIEVGIRLPEGLKLKGLDIHSSLQLDIWDLLGGCEASIMTVEGPKKIVIPPGYDPKNPIILKGLGWIDNRGKMGDHKVELEVQFPITPPTGKVKRLIRLIRLLKKMWPTRPWEKAISP